MSEATAALSEHVESSARALTFLGTAAVPSRDGTC
jgi:hypothetical protein